jgi:hypothetical protein
VEFGRGLAGGGKEDPESQESIAAEQKWLQFDPIFNFVSGVSGTETGSERESERERERE